MAVVVLYILICVLGIVGYYAIRWALAYVGEGAAHAKAESVFAVQTNGKIEGYGTGHPDFVIVYRKCNPKRGEGKGWDYFLERRTKKNTGPKTRRAPANSTVHIRRPEETDFVLNWLNIRPFGYPGVNRTVRTAIKYHKDIKKKDGTTYRPGMLVDSLHIWHQHTIGFTDVEFGGGFKLNIDLQVVLQQSRPFHAFRDDGRFDAMVADLSSRLLLFAPMIKAGDMVGYSIDDKKRVIIERQMPENPFAKRKEAVVASAQRRLCRYIENHIRAFTNYGVQTPDQVFGYFYLSAKVTSIVPGTELAAMIAAVERVRVKEAEEKEVDAKNRIKISEALAHATAMDHRTRARVKRVREIGEAEAAGLKAQVLAMNNNEDVVGRIHTAREIAPIKGTLMTGGNMGIVPTMDVRRENPASSGDTDGTGTTTQAAGTKSAA